MGQYYYVVNLDKRQYLHPHKFCDGLKLLEFGCSMEGTMTGLAILLADGNNRGGGDLRSEHPIIGSWAGDRIVIAGDYADPHKFVPEDVDATLKAKMLQDQATRKDLTGQQIAEYAEANCNLYQCAQEFFEDISDQIIRVMCEDTYLRKTLLEKGVVRKRNEPAKETALRQEPLEID